MANELSNIKVNIIYGTVYGSAQYTAETVANALTEKGAAVNLVKTEALANFVPDEASYLIAVCSTTGQGDLPDDILPWFARIKSDAPYLPKLKYSIIGLGDSSYETFCGAAKQLDELFAELGASAITPRLEIDATETMEPEAEALTWISTWQAALSE